MSLAIAVAGVAFARIPQDAQSPKQDMKDAGHAAKNAAKDTGHENGAKNSARRQACCTQIRSQNTKTGAEGRKQNSALAW
jgi:hypothetical protein